MPLVKNVHVPGDGWWGPAYGRCEPPFHVAQHITNPDCWSDGDDWAEGLVEVSLPEPPEPTGATYTTGDIAERVAADLDTLTRDQLASLAGDLGVKADGRWGAQRLRREIRAALP